MIGPLQPIRPLELETTRLSNRKPSKMLGIPLSVMCAFLMTASHAGLAQNETKTKAKETTAGTKAKNKAAETKQEKEKAKTPTPIDLNKATAEEMIEVLPGVGEATAKKIVAGRPYKSVDDLLKAGVPQRTLDGIRSLVTVKAATPPQEKVKARAKEVVKEKGEMAKAAPEKTKVNLNTSPLDELQTLPGVGEVTAKAIVAGRPYKTVDELEKVKGLSQAKIEALRPLVLAAPAAETPKPEVAKESATRKPAMAKTKEAAAKKEAETIKPGEIVNINTASKEVLDKLPGIGPVKAQAILDARPFKTKEDIMKVKGIKDGEYSKIKDIISVD